MVFSGKVQFLGLIALAVILCGADVASAQRGGFGGFGGTSKFDAAKDEKVKEAYEISKDQSEELEELGTERDEMRREAFMELRGEWGNGGDRTELFQKMRDSMDEIEKEVNERMSEILLPHQMEGLGKVVLQQELRRNPQSALEKALEQIGGTEEQIEAFKEAMEKNQKEYAKKVEKLRIQTLDKSLKEAFRAAQVKDFYKLVGLEDGGTGGIEMAQQGFRGGQQRGGQQRGGDRGNRGTDRGGDRGNRGGGRDRGSDF